MYAALREQDPVHRVIPVRDPSADYWVLSRHRDVFEAARDPETFSSASGLTVEYDELDKIGLRDNPPFVMQDPPTHTEFRRTVSRGFTPRQVISVEPAVRAFVVDRLDRLAEAGEGDIVAELFKPLPTMVVAHYLGVPPEDRDRFDAWSHDIVAASSAGRPFEAAEAVGGLMTYFTELAERRRRDPGDDTISHLVAAGAADDVDSLLSILSFAFTMVTGGNDTTTGMLGGAVQLLTSRPDQRDLLVADPGLIPDAVEELLRLTAPVQCLARTTTRDVEIDGTTIPMGRKVLLLYGSANRDQLKYGPDAEALDVTRKPTHIMTFSHGNHHCLGAAAARMQARVALEELLARFPHFEVDIDGVEYAPGPYIRRPTHVPFRVGPFRAGRR
ncbi:MAG: cytochrome monooxygenase [Aeromicrobium sp.]|nr:cytochrome monooxygenase [Aeromicrobium sp.]